MKTNKEYPATHSMSTAWYVADEEGNVAIISYNENGPVPWETEESSVEQLVFGHEEDVDTREMAYVKLTDEQIDELIEKQHDSKEEQYWSEGCVVQIDIEKENEFFDLVDNEDFCIEACVSKKRGLYQVDALCCINFHHKDQSTDIIEGSPLQKMLDMNIILSVFHLKNFDVDETGYGEDTEFVKHFDEVPYYIYFQPYWPESLLERMNIPKHPVKLKQFPESLQKRIPIVPIRFDQQKNFQIAEWHPCHFYSGDREIVDGYMYTLTTLTNGSEAYVMTDMNAFCYCYCCPERDKNDCTNRCHLFEVSQFTSQPTVLFVVAPWKMIDYNHILKPDIIIQHSVRISFITRLPISGDTEKNKSKRLNEIISEEFLTDLFLRSCGYLEKMIARFSPRVIIFDDVAYSVISKRYDLSSRKIVVDDAIYPIYIESEIDSHKKEIESLSLLPYRGVIMPHVISKEDMERLKSTNHD